MHCKCAHDVDPFFQKTEDGGCGKCHRDANLLVMMVEQYQ